MRFKLFGKKALAVMLVALMVSSCFLPLGSDESDAAVGDGGYYSYTIEYDSSQMTVTDGSSLNVDGMDAVYHPSYDSVNDTTTGYGSWTWDRYTGLGPFNSFYGAFDRADGNKLLYRLDPFDLTKTIDGNSLPTGYYNIMWVLPTVYWYTDENDNLVLTNDSSTGGVAYAHTIDGHVYNYIAIAVYESYKRTENGVDILTSEPNVYPSNNYVRADFRQWANNYVMDSSLSIDGGYLAHSMLWNFYQWELYKYCCFALIENFNAQSTVGNGEVYSPGLDLNTGQTDKYGPYYGNPNKITSSTTINGQSPAKLFIENAWGSLSEFVDGVLVDGRSGFYIDTNHSPSDSTAGSNIVYVASNGMTANGYATDISTTTQVWGMQTGVNNGDSSQGVYDYQWNGTGTRYVANIGGSYSTSVSATGEAGLSFIGCNNAISLKSGQVTSRLAFVFDVDTTLTTVSVDSDDTSMGTVDKASIRGITVGSLITVNGNVLTIGSESVTASVNDPTAQYSYTFTGWYDSSDNPITNSTRVTKNMQIVAKFNASINSYTITWNIEGQLSTETYQYGQTPTHADPTKDHYTFTGWDPAIVPVTEDATYTAVFTPTVYAVTWNPNGGTVEPTVTYGTVETPVLMPTPHQTDYDFSGWFTAAEDGDRITNPYYPTSDITLYAHWDTSDIIELSTLLFPLVGILAILAMVALFFRSEGEGLSFQYMTVADMGKAVVGVAVATVIMVLLFFPIID